MTCLDPHDERPHATGKAARTRLRLVDAARRSIEDDGTVSAEAVARRADASPATYYNHFSSNEAAVAAAFDAAMVDLVAFVAAELDLLAVLDVGLETFLTDWTWRSFDFFRANSAVFGLAKTHLRRNAEIRSTYVASEAEASDHYRRFVRLGQRAGVFRDGDVDAMAEVLMLQSEGWNHPRVLGCAHGSPLHRELVAATYLHLTATQPDPTQEPSR